MTLEEGDWKKRFEKVDKERRELADILDAIKSGHVDTVLSPKGTLRLQDTKLIEENERLLTELKSSKLQLEVLLNSAGEGILGIDTRGNIHFANPKACRILDISLDVIQTRKIQSFISLNKEDFQSLDAIVKAHSGSPKILLADWEKYQIAQLMDDKLDNDEQTGHWITSKGERFYTEFCCNATLDANSHCVGAVVMFQNISERKELEDQLVQLANYDTLTGLANRAHFHNELSRALERQKRTSKALGLLYLDMDHFKYINDSLGHDAGDRMLIMAADKIRENVRTSDLVARLGGDEFAVVLYDINGPEDASLVAKKIINALMDPVGRPPAIQVNVSFSIGIAMLSDQLASLNDLLIAADTAMYAAKAEGRNTYKHYVAHMQEEAEQKQRLQTLLQSAITNNEFSLVYQPKISLATKKIMGCEALLRWTPKNEDSIGPAIFIPVAEESCQINEIGEWVLKAVIAQVSHWRNLPEYQGIVTSFNVSAGQLGRNVFFPLIKRVLKEYGVLANEIEIEITETKMMDNLELVVDELRNIHDLGVKISIDDFGTGNSSLDLLRKLPLDILKIDRSFIADIGQDEQDEEIIRVIIAVAKTLELEIVAEGVETLEQLLFLTAASCDMVQGYYFSKPIDVGRFTKLFSGVDDTVAQNFIRLDEALVSKSHIFTDDTAIKGLPKKSILICEDEISTGYFIQCMLEDNGYIGDIALSATECFSMLKNKHYCAMTLDMELGDANGLEFLKDLQIKNPNLIVPVIVVSSHTPDKMRQDKYKNLKISSWVQKPVVEEQLIESVNKALERIPPKQALSDEYIKALNYRNNRRA